jgi:hypothetical protein
LLPKVQPPPAPLKVTEALTALVAPNVTVLPVVVELKVIVPFLFAPQVAAELFQLPETVKAVLLEASNITVPDVQVKFKHNPPLSAIVGEPERLSTITSSAAVGFAAVAVPPDEVANFELPVAVQLPEPPTQ